MRDIDERRKDIKNQVVFTFFVNCTNLFRYETNRDLVEEMSEETKIDYFTQGDFWKFSDVVKIIERGYCLTEIPFWEIVKIETIGDLVAYILKEKLEREK